MQARLVPTLSTTLLLLALAVPALAQDARTQFTIESRLLERDLDLYETARQRERQAISRLRELASQVDTTLVDPNAALSTLRDLEARLSAARETAFLRAKETADVRLSIYDRMERLVQLAQAVERLDPATLAGADGPTGMWQIELQKLDVHGLMKLVVEGQLVRGSYRLSNGNHGSLRGTWTGGELELEVIHSEQGQVANLRGELDSSGSTLSGWWGAMELGAGRAEAGPWAAYLVTDDQSLELDQ